MFYSLNRLRMPWIHCISLATLLPVSSIFAADNTSQVTLNQVEVTAQSSNPMSEGSDDYSLARSNTATGLSLSPRHTPQTLTTISQAQMDDFQLTSTTDMLEQGGGVTVLRVETDRNYYISRGFEISNFQIDGVGMPFATGDQMGDIDTALYDHIDVIKGANGLTSNPGNPSATVNFVRKRPTRDPHASVDLRYGSWNTKRAVVDVSGPLTQSGNWRGRLIGAFQDGDSYLDRYSLRKNAYSAIIAGDLSDDITLTLGHLEQHNRPMGTMWGALPLYYTNGQAIDWDRSASTATDWSYWNTNDKQSFAELSYQLNPNWESLTTLTYRKMSSDAKLFYVTGHPDPDTGLGVNSYPSIYNHQERQLMLSSKLTGTFDLAGFTHQASIGINWSRSRSHLASIYDDIGISVGDIRDFDGDFPEPDWQDTTSNDAHFSVYRRSLFASTKLTLPANFSLLLGANFSNLQSDGDQYGVAHQYDRNHISPYIGVMYDINDHHTLYASYTDIFNPQYKIDANMQVLDPITGKSYEMGWKGAWRENSLNASVSLFKTQQNNTAESAGFDQSIGATVYQGVDIESTGFEATLSGRLMRGWQVNAAYTHMFHLQDNDHEAALTYVPRETLMLGSVIDIPWVHGLKTGLNVRWQSKTYRNQGTTDGGDTIISTQSAYAVTNWMASYQINKQTRVSLNVNNIFDEKYLTSLYASQSFYGAPRNASVNLHWSY
ncbi:TonB-dependent siderophore receptor [Celerinatantimonas sp. MCCC 1A17872]|uniref:TonB-dependent siderophore receptor n=1 Tax=Celerinatantimonas sp. MCCC 1A17872 TaxID=3177514 RepID=UPI0038BE8E21